MARLTPVPVFQGGISDIVTGLQYKGLWNALSNTPVVISGVGTVGDYWVVSVAGTTLIDGVNEWAVGDWLVFNGSTWQKIDNSEPIPVSSIYLQSGALTAGVNSITHNLALTSPRQVVVQVVDSFGVITDPILQTFTPNSLQIVLAAPILLATIVICGRTTATNAYYNLHNLVAGNNTIVHNLSLVIPDKCIIQGVDITGNTINFVIVSKGANSIIINVPAPITNASISIIA
jgi:hypothetical protein